MGRIAEVLDARCVERGYTRKKLVDQFIERGHGPALIEKIICGDVASCPELFPIVEEVLGDDEEFVENLTHAVREDIRELLIQQPWYRERCAP